MTSGERETRLNRLRATTGNERGVLTNARCLSEGVDVPTLDGVAFIDPRRSQVDVVQAVGRAIRKADDKTVGTIIIPVFVDEAVDAVDALDSSEFNRVWQVVKALRDHDEVIAEELDGYRRELGRSGSLGKLSSKIILDLPSSISADFALAFDTRLVDESTASWEFWYGVLERYVDRENNVFVPKGHVEEDGLRLGQWVQVQRTWYKAGKLSAERSARLAGLPGWDWYPQDVAWEEGFTALERFGDRENHLLVPQSHVEDDGYRLGRWVNVQRRFHAERKLSPERIARLTALPGWQWNSMHAAWEKGYAALERFVHDNGHARVPSGHYEDGERLGQWVVVQRSFYGQGKLSDERAKRLTEVSGWEWSPLDADWNKGYACLQRFAAAEGHARVPSNRVEEDGYRLGGWVIKQRARRNDGRLSDERAERLEALPGWVWAANRTRL